MQLTLCLAWFSLSIDMLLVYNWHGGGGIPNFGLSLVRAPAEATILVFFLLLSLGMLFKTPAGVVVGFQNFALSPN